MAQNRLIIAPLTVLLFTFFQPCDAQNPFPDEAPIYQKGIVARIDITLSPDSLEMILAPGNERSDHHFSATFRFDNGNLQETIENVGFRLRGNTSRYAAKKSFKVSFNTYEPGRKWYGVEKLNFNGEHNDPSISRSVICWDLLRDIGVPAPRASHVQLYINGAYYGVYANVEHIDEEFVATRFGNRDGNLYKCLWPADLKYLGENPDLYKLKNGDRRVYELITNKEEDDYSDLAHFIAVLNNTPLEELRCELEAIFNINSFLLSMAFDVLSGNWDGPLFNKNNFYLYHNQANGLFEFIPYDLDNTFGIDWFGINWAERNIYSWGATNENRPLYWRILEVPEYKDRFSYFMNKILMELYSETVLFPEIDEMKALLEPFVAEDSFYPLSYGFSMQDFHNSFVQTLPYNHTPTGLKTFISNRRESAINQLQLNDLTPIISRVSSNQANAKQEIVVQASLEDDQGLKSVKICYQLNEDGAVRCVEMSDDGLHLDDLPGDGRYGVLIPPLETSAILTYYIEAIDLNGNISRDPVCGTRQLVVGDASIPLAINEIMASNDTTIADEFGEFDDWVEIYNYGDVPIYLGDRYLSDNPNIPQKWSFPNISIQPGEFLLVWTDDDEEQGELHTNYKLSAAGEFIGIFDHDDNSNQLIDGLEFGPQVTDQALGRFPNGTGVFQLLTATPGNSNAVSSNTKELSNLSINYQIFPNPTHDLLYLQADQLMPQPQRVFLLNAFGQVIQEKNWQTRLVINLEHLPSGLYFLGTWEKSHFSILGKVIKE